MNGGEGAARRHAEHMLATGQWTYGSEWATDPKIEEEQHQRYLDAVKRQDAVKASFLQAMEHAGEPGSKVLPEAHSGDQIRCWTVGERHQQWERSTQTTTYAFGTNGALYVETTIPQRKPLLQRLTSSSEYRSVPSLRRDGGPMAPWLAERLEELAARHGLVLPSRDQS